MNKQKGITSIAVMIIMLVLAIALPVTTRLVQQNQENRSKAAGATDPAICINPNEYRWAYTGGVCKRVLARYCIGCQITTGGELTCYAGTDLGETTCKKDNIKDCTTTGCSSGYSCQRQDNMWQCLKTTTSKHYTVYKNGSCQTSSNTYASLTACNADPPVNNCYNSMSECNAAHTAAACKCTTLTGAKINTNTTWCDGSDVWKCVDYGSGSCGGEPVNSCSNGQTCSNGRCVGGSTPTVKPTATPTRAPTTANCDGGIRFYNDGSGNCRQGTTADCTVCGGNKGLCYASVLGCKSTCDGTPRVYWNGSSCVTGTTKDCYACAGNYKDCYNNNTGCTGAHPTTTKVNGECGSAGGVPTSSQPTTNLCKNGQTVVWTSPNGTDGYYQWLCKGTDGGYDAICNANKIAATAPVNGICGTTKNTCTAGTLSGEDDSGDWYTWMCKGLNGGTNNNFCRLKKEITTTDCTESNWTSVLSPVACPSNSQQTRTWTQVGTCTGGVTHPSTETVSCTYNAGDSVISIKLAFAGVKLNNGQCATNWPVTLKMVDSTGKSVVDQIFSGVPTQTASINSKGEIIYDFNVTVSNVPGAGGSDLAFFLAGPKHISLKYGKNNQSVWYSNLVGTLGLIRGSTNSYDFSGYSLLAGDVTGEKDGTPDGKIDGRDFSYIKEKANVLASGAAGTSVSGDLDGNCQVNSGDVRLIKQSLTEINGQTY